MNIRKELKQWADVHMERDRKHKVYPVWNKTWYSASDHICMRLRLCGNDFGADIVVLSCPGGYGATEADWSGVNLGNAQSMRQIESLYAWMDDKTGYVSPAVGSCAAVS